MKSHKQIKALQDRVDLPCPVAFWKTKHNPITGYLPAKKSKKKTKNPRRND